MADWLAPNCSRVPTAAKLSSITVYPSCMPLRQDPLLGEVAIDSRPFFFFFFVFLCSNNLLMARFPYFLSSSSTRTYNFSPSLSLSHIVHDGQTVWQLLQTGHEVSFCVCYWAYTTNWPWPVYQQPLENQQASINGQPWFFSVVSPVRLSVRRFKAFTSRSTYIYSRIWRNDRRKKKTKCKATIQPS